MAHMLHSALGNSTHDLLVFSFDVIYFKRNQNFGPFFFGSHQLHQVLQQLGLVTKL